MPKITFKDFDKFSRQEFADRLTTVVTKFYPFYDGAFVLSLNGKFGSGKTTFLDMWKQDLETKKFEVVYINAWETDFEDEPLIPLLGAILENLNKPKDSTKLQDALKGAMGATVTAGDQLLSKFTGIKGKEIYQSYQTGTQSEDIQKLGETLFKNYTFKKKAYEELKEKLSEYVQTINEKPLIIFVDELDRARPDYSIRFLEAIKHIFPIQGICFVLAVDRKQLEASVRQLYGSVDFENYYARFITREASLPPVTATQMTLTPFIQHLADDFFGQMMAQGIHFPFKVDQQKDILEHMSQICQVWEFTPRQIEYLFRIFSQLMAVGTMTQFLNINAIKGIIMFIAVFIHNKPFYDRIGKGDCSPNELFDYLKGLNLGGLSSTGNERYLIVNAMCYRLRDGDQDELNQIADIVLKYDCPQVSDQERPGLRNQTIDSLKKALIPLIDDLPKNYGFQDFYNNIEQWRSFVE